MLRLFKLPKEPETEGLRLMRRKDIIPMTKLLKNHLEYVIIMPLIFPRKYKFHVNFN